MAWTLGQLGDLDAGSKVALLPDPPMVTHSVLENPYPLATVLCVAGLAAFVALNRAARARQALLAGTAGLALAVLVLAAGLMVTTTGELLIARTRELVAVTARADTAALSPMLAQDVSFTTMGTGAAPIGRNLLLTLVEKYPGGMYRVKEHSVSKAQGLADSANTARTQVRVRAVVEGIPNGSWWRLHWRCDGEKADAGAWKVTAIELMQIDGVRDLSEVRP